VSTRRSVAPGNPELVEGTILRPKRAGYCKPRISRPCILKAIPEVGEEVKDVRRFDRASCPLFGGIFDTVQKRYYSRVRSTTVMMLAVMLSGSILEVVLFHQRQSDHLVVRLKTLVVGQLSGSVDKAEAYPALGATPVFSQV